MNAGLFDAVILYLGSFDVLGDFVEVAVELSQFGLHHISAGGPPAGHQDDGLVLHIVHAQTDILQLLEHALRTDSREVGHHLSVSLCYQSLSDWMAV